MLTKLQAAQQQQQQAVQQQQQQQQVAAPAQQEQAAESKQAQDPQAPEAQGPPAAVAQDPSVQAAQAAQAAQDPSLQAAQSACPRPLLPVLNACPPCSPTDCFCPDGKKLTLEDQAKANEVSWAASSFQERSLITLTLHHTLFLPGVLEQSCKNLITVMFVFHSEQSNLEQVLCRY